MYFLRSRLNKRNEKTAFWKWQIENWKFWVVIEKREIGKILFWEIGLKNLKYFSEVVEKTWKFYNKKIEVLNLFLRARNYFSWFHYKSPSQWKKSLPVGIWPSDHVSGLVMPQIAAWSLISWLVSLGFLHADASAFELIAIKILNSLISIFAAAVVDKGEASRFPVKFYIKIFFFSNCLKLKKFVIFGFLKSDT